MSLNRRRSPRVSTISGVKLPDSENIFLDNGLPVTLLHGSETEALRLDICFKVGRQHEHKRMVARATASMLKEGSSQYSGKAFADKMDTLGSSWESPVQLDYSHFSWLGLSRFGMEALPVIADILENPTFPTSEIHAFVQRNVARLKVELTKPDVVGYRTFTAILLGENHPFGWNSSQEIFEDLTKEDLQKHHSDWYNTETSQCFLSGNVPLPFLDRLNKTVGQLFIGKKSPPSSVIPKVNPTFGTTEVKLPGTLQSSLHIGYLTGVRQHDDYPTLLVLNTILGGFFGSRLMTNIREKLGYTYHIQSNLDTYPDVGSLWINAELSPDYLNPTRKEIFKEINLLKNKPVSNSFLKMVKSYLIGSELNALDGTLQAMEVIRERAMEGLEKIDYATEIEKINSVSPFQLQEMANKYFSQDNFTEVRVTP
jgi:predicted Zn-dependent peptidase